MRAYGFQSAILSISFLIMISHLSLSSPISVTNYIVDKNSSSGPFLRRLSVFLLKPFDELNSSNWSFLLILDLIENFSIFENISIRFDMLQSTMLPSRLIQEQVVGSNFLLLDSSRGKSKLMHQIKNAFVGIRQLRCLSLNFLISLAIQKRTKTLLTIFSQQAVILEGWRLLQPKGQELDLPILLGLLQKRLNGSWRNLCQCRLYTQEAVSLCRTFEIDQGRSSGSWLENQSRGSQIMELSCIEDTELQKLLNFVFHKKLNQEKVNYYNKLAKLLSPHEIELLGQNVTAQKVTAKYIPKICHKNSLNILLPQFLIQQDYNKVRHLIFITQSRIIELIHFFILLFILILLQLSIKYECCEPSCFSLICFTLSFYRIQTIRRQRHRQLDCRNLWWLLLMRLD